jgi:signal transduction histidine kinase
LFFIYGVLAGLVVNEGSFFPANIINQNVFNSIIILPVQLIRSICAVAIAVNISIILNVFKTERMIENQNLMNNISKTNNELHRLNKELQENKDGLEKANVKLRQILTERKKLELVLRDSEYFFKESQRAAFIGSYRADFIADVWHSSEVLDIIFGIDKNYDRSIHGWINLIHIDDREMMNKYLMEIIGAQHKAFNRKYRIIRMSDKEVRWVHGLGELNADKNGNIISMIGTIQDITRRKAIDDALARHVGALTTANDNLQAFAHAMAHDLRNPITVIKGLSDTINRLYSKNIDKKIRNLLIRISGSATSMNTIIDGLLMLYNISRETMTIEDIEIKAIAIAIIAELRESQPNRTVEFITRGNLKVRGDSKLITIMLSNLIKNAWKFTAKTANPIIELFECSDKSICLKDNGAGFDMAKADEIFIPFKRLHAKSDFEGTGLGLAIVHQAIERHNGKIWAKGEPGKGAEIYFTLG